MEEMEILLAYNVPYKTIHTVCVTNGAFACGGILLKALQNILIKCGVRNDCPRLVLCLLTADVPDPVGDCR
jgi:hypothetical protein